MAKLQITLNKSVIGTKPNQRKVVEALGLRKLNQTVEQADNAAIRGMITKVAHLVTVKEIYFQLYEQGGATQMKLHELKPAEGSRKVRNRVGRGIGSGNGKTAGRGHKGQNARSGGGVRPGFEGGQNPLFRRLPKRGFTNINRKEYAIVNLDALNRFEDGAEVTPALLLETGIVSNEKAGIKILGHGTLSVKLNVKAHKFSASAKEAIENAGGTTEVI